MRLQRYCIGYSLANNESFSFSAKTPIKVLGIAEHPEGTSLYYLEEESNSDRYIAGDVKDEGDTIYDYELGQFKFVGTAHGKCIFLKVMDKDIIKPDITSEEIVESLEEEIDGGRLNNLLMNIGHQMIDGAGFVLNEIIEKVKTEALQACDNELKSELDKSYRIIIKEHNELKTKIDDAKARLEKLKQDDTLRKVEYLAKELQYEKNFVDEHPF